MANLVGNISNLQLRILRKYFNDAGMGTEDTWNPDRLHRFFFRWVRSWHCKLVNEKKNRNTLLELKDREKDILEILTTTNPELTIPPYEDQNNRRPPKDLTLRLKPKGLDICLKNWQVITQSLYDISKPRQSIQEGLQDNVHLQKIKSVDQDTAERQILADTLHRILDRSSVLDPYRIRLQVQFRHSDFNGNLYPKDKNEKLSSRGELKDIVECSYARLLKRVGSKNIVDFIQLARDYYKEVDIIKQGLWTDNENTLFFRCDTNPPHKNKIQHNLISHILGESLDKEKLENFINDCWNSSAVKVGRSKLLNVAKNAEEERKVYGNRFKELVNRQVWLDLEEQRKNGRTLDTKETDGVDGKKILKIHKDCLLAADKIAKCFKHSDKQKKIYANVFSMTQLYNILETQINGFSKTDRWNTIENAWRSRKDNFDDDGEPIANAVRLAADSIRPFDGMLDRIISRQAYEIAQLKIEQIERIGVDKNETLFVPILMEQNRFKFEQDMHDIKGSKNVKKKTRDNTEKGLKKQEKQWQSKNNRIKFNIRCPYTDESISLGEIDHIVPQSQSKKRGDVVFNSEANLIYCSGNGNHTKGDDRYTFNDLKQNYLIEVFRHSDKQKIQQEITDFVSNLDENNTVFHNLDEQGQNYLRHALFILELDHKIFPILNTRFKTFVNGTQGYLGKQIRKSLQDKYPNVEVKTYQVDAEKVSQLRTVLGVFDNNLAKQDRQGTFSHIVDASMVLAAALQNEQIAKELKTINIATLSQNKQLDLAAKAEQGQWLKNLLPTNAEVQHIERRPKYRKNLASTQIFKEGLYGERFMSILLNDNKLYCGFALDNCREIDRLKEPKKGKDFDKRLKTAQEKQLQAHNAYYDLLKEFLYTGSARKQNKQAVKGSLADNQQKYTYLAIEKTKALTHLQKCSKTVCNDEEVRQAEALEKLRYSVEKKKIKDVLLKGVGKKTFVNQLDDEKFKVSDLKLPAKADWLRLLQQPVKDYQGNKTTLKKCFGKDGQVEIDNSELARFWENLSKESNLSIDDLKDSLLKKNDKGEFTKQKGIIPKGVFSSKIKTDTTLQKLKDNTRLNKSFGLEFKIKTDLIPQESWDALFREFFHTDKVKNTSNHRQVRKDYSLPIVSAPSGGFRIKRKNSVTGDVVFQVSNIEGFATKGYDKTLKQPVLIDRLFNSPNIATLGEKQNIPDEVCYFDQWRAIQMPDDLNQKITNLSYALGSKTRFYIKVAMPFNEFKKLDDTITHFANIPAEVKESKKNDNWTFKKVDFQKYFSSSLIGKPRSNLFVEFVDANKIVFSYIVDSTNKEMKTAYKNGTPV